MSGNRLVFSVFILALGFCLGTEPAHGLGDRIVSFGIWMDPVPPPPLSSTPIRVRAGGTFVDSCFEVCDVQGEWLTPFEFQLDWYVRDTSTELGVICFGVITTLSSTLELGLLEPGDYLVTATLYVVDWDDACAEGTPVRNHQIQFIIYPDCNGNGTHDWTDIGAGTSEDCNGNLIPDECEPDCNDNSVADGCDIAAGTSEDCNGNLIPDECEPDCNDNNVADDCDIAAGTSEDCNGNLIPDECEPDCNDNNVADDCDIAAGTSLDENGDGIPDECEITVPTLSGWGLAVMVLLLFSAARVHFRRQSEARPGGVCSTDSASSR